MMNQKQENNKKHIPMRMCAVTKEKRPKDKLVRFGIDENNLVLDNGLHLKGRGISIVPDIEVFDLGIKRKVFERAFGISFKKENIEKVREELFELIERRNRRTIVVRISNNELDKLKKDK